MTNSWPNSKELLKLTRSGSRTLLWDLDSPELALELARHGYRLMLVAAPEQPALPLRELLAQTGLQSQLMGRTTYRSEAVSLARGFYELVIFCQEVPIEAALLEPALRPDAMVIWQKGRYEPTLPHEVLTSELNVLRYRV